MNKHGRLTRTNRLVWDAKGTRHNSRHRRLVSIGSQDGTRLFPRLAGAAICARGACTNSLESHHRLFGCTSLVLDACKLGRLENRVNRTYHAWRNVGGGYEDVAGFCRSATLEEIAVHDFVLTPGRYVGVEEVEDDGEPFEEKMDWLVRALSEQQAKGRRLDKVIGQALQLIGYST